MLMLLVQSLHFEIHSFSRTWLLKVDQYQIASSGEMLEMQNFNFSPSPHYAFYRIRICILIRSPGDSQAHRSLKNTVLEEVKKVEKKIKNNTLTLMLGMFSFEWWRVMVCVLAFSTGPTVPLNPINNPCHHKSRMMDLHFYTHPPRQSRERVIIE